MAKPLPEIKIRSRFRTTGNALPTTETWKDVNQVTGAVVSGPFSTSGRLEYQDYTTMNDSVINAFHARQQRGQIVNLPYSKESVTTGTPKGSWSYGYLQSGQQVIATASGSDAFYFAAPNWAFPSGVNALTAPNGMKTDSALIDLATIAAKANVMKPEALALVIAAELGKTISMVTKSASGMAKALEALARGRPKKAIVEALGGGLAGKSSKFRKGSKTASSKWLEVQYGWLPLIYDVQGVLRALNGLPKPRYTARGFANDSGESTTNSTFQTVGLVSFSLNTKLEKRVRAYILYEADLRTILTNKLGALQLPATVWELVTFSFVVDWFVDIGQWLDAMTPRVGVNVLAEGYTFEKTGSRVRLITGAVPTSPYNQVNGLTGQSDVFFGRTKTRVTRLNSLPLPRVNVRVSPKRALDAIALLVQAFSKAR